MPAHKNPADAYYFINVLGRGQLIDWTLSPKSPAREAYESGKMIHFLREPYDGWVMRAPRREHPAIWHETDRKEDQLIYAGNGKRVFVTTQLGDALNQAFPGQCRLKKIREI